MQHLAKQIGAAAAILRDRAGKAFVFEGGIAQMENSLFQMSLFDSDTYQASITLQN